MSQNYQFLRRGRRARPRKGCVAVWIKSASERLRRENKGTETEARGIGRVRVFAAVRQRETSDFEREGNLGAWRTVPQRANLEACIAVSSRARRSTGSEVRPRVRLKLMVAGALGLLIVCTTAMASFWR